MTSEQAVSRQQETNGTYYVDPNGQESSICDQAAVWTMQNGQLKSNGNFISTPSGVTSAPFAVSPSLSMTTTKFSVTRGLLNWINPGFHDGQATFCSFANGTVDAVFNGSAPEDCIPVALSVVPGRDYLLENSSRTIALSRHFAEVHSFIL